MVSPGRAPVKPRLIDRQNRVALPPEALSALGVKAGDYVTFEIEGKAVKILKVVWSPGR
jgi:bifunctional DNA-binding transcriptional regulator/antitoxin component of YhaV-PrlF toxin-antitoxin module